MTKLDEERSIAVGIITRIIRQNLYRGQPRRLPIFLHERIRKMAVFRVERIKDYTVMSNHHLRNKIYL